MFFNCWSADVICCLEEDSVWLTGADWCVLFRFVEHSVDGGGWVSAISKVCFQML